MKLEQAPQDVVITQCKGTLDIYPYVYKSGRRIWIVRSWPRKPRDRSGKFKKTHIASKLVIDGYKAIPKNIIRHLLTLFRTYQQYPLDWYRSVNQSLAYKNQIFPSISKIEIIRYDKQTQEFEVDVTKPSDFLTRSRIRPLDAAQLPFQIVTKFTRKSKRKCKHVPKTIPEHIINPISPGAIIDTYHIPDNSYCIFECLGSGSPGPEHEILIHSGNSSVIDNFITNWNPLVNFGSLHYLNAALFYTRDYRPIIRFNISLVPAGKEIVSCVLTMTCENPATCYQHRYVISRLIAEFEELTSTWINRKTATPWSSPGGDYEGIYFDEGVPTNGGLVADITTLFKLWYDGTPNFGFILRDIFSSTYLTRLFSSDYGIIAFKPQLLVKYRDPAPPGDVMSYFFPLIFNHDKGYPNFG